MTFAPTTTEMNVYMVFGQTGNGKSTLIKLYCGDNVPSTIVGHGTKSKTKDTSFFSEIDKNNKLNRIWIDTMGTSDSDDKISNEDILRKVMVKMYEKCPNGLNVKVIWVVKKDCRSSKDLNIEAKFINSLTEYSNSSIWDSTIIIVKEGQPKPKKNVKGALAAAARYCDKTITDKDNDVLAEISVIGYTMLSALHDDNPVLQLIEDGHMNDICRKTTGYLWDDEIKNVVGSLLDSKSFINVTFKKEKCLKCGINGDPRFVPTKCHKQFERKHFTPQNNDDLDDEEKYEKFCHTGEKKWRHKDGETIIVKHTSFIGQKSHKSTSTRQKYIGQEICGFSKTTECFAGHSISDLRRVTSGSYKCDNKNCKRKLREGDNFYFCWQCSSSGGVVCKSSCAREKNGDPNFRSIYETVHSCCNQPHPSTNYCKSEWLCCGNDTSHPGCTKEWSLCKKGEDNKGCEEYWTCCDEPVKGNKSSKGCSYTCCKKKKDSRGCQKVCKQCGALYSKGPGCCTENVKHKF